jgi:D-tyrosyl-tRNA(Tyr) deacylase
MKVVIQRVSEANVVVNGKTTGKIQQGLLILVGFEKSDNEDDYNWISNKICNLRIFNDDDGVMNLSVNEVDGDILLVSQFTLHASTKQGNRPSYIKASKPDIAKLQYETFHKVFKQNLGKEFPTGIFGADMKVSLTNDGPVTIIIDSKNKE